MQKEPHPGTQDLQRGWTLVYPGVGREAEGWGGREGGGWGELRLAACTLGSSGGLERTHRGPVLCGGPKMDTGHCPDWGLHCPAEDCLMHMNCKGPPNQPEDGGNHHVL